MHIQSSFHARAFRNLNTNLPAAKIHRRQQYDLLFYSSTVMMEDLIKVSLMTSWLRKQAADRAAGNAPAPRAAEKEDI